MATKISIENLIGINLGDSPLIIPEKHREVEQAFVDEFYSGVVEDTNLTSNVFIGSFPAGVTYNVFTSKVGNKVTVNGTIKNESAFLVSGTPLKIINSVYLPYNLTPSSINVSSIKKMALSSSLASIRIFDFININEEVDFSITYTTTDV